MNEPGKGRYYSEAANEDPPLDCFRWGAPKDLKYYAMRSYKQAHFSIQMTWDEYHMLCLMCHGGEAIERELELLHRRIYLTDREYYVPITETDARNFAFTYGGYNDPWKGYWQVTECEMLCAMKHHDTDLDGLLKIAQREDVYFFVTDAEKRMEERRLERQRKGYGQIGRYLDIPLKTSRELAAEILRDNRGLPSPGPIVLGIDPALGRDSSVQAMMKVLEEGGYKIVTLDSIPSFEVSREDVMARMPNYHFNDAPFAHEGPLPPTNRRERRAQSKGKLRIGQSKHKRGEWWNK